MKKNNKGFSLVELIIVIAIMAILAGAIAPALIKYIDKSRRSNDVTSAKTIKTAVETALGGDSIYELLTTGTGAIIEVEPGENTSNASTAGQYGVTILEETYGAGDDDGKINGKAVADLKLQAEKTIAQNIGEKTPKLKYRKNASDPKGDTTNVPTKFVAVVSNGGTVYVFISSDAGNISIDGSGNVTCDDGKAWQIAPEICDEYQ